ncbi:hypothetical protein [Amycolatopsis anabasis]|uniref:hypothetical protein n=1 Tax=Amycolatopsis anabasis TaxID=1840409 RepID=UPI00131AC2B4|nr:hypothetical protein [Amycolatopsis anabasis]
MGGIRRRVSRPNRLWKYLSHQRYYVAIVAALLVVVGVLLAVSSSLADYGPNLGLNLGADLIGTIVVLFLIAPLINRADQDKEKRRERFHHHEFMNEVETAQDRVRILELWLDLLQDEYKETFVNAVRAALDRGIDVRILILDPDAEAAEQRNRDLHGQTNVMANILDNLRVLYGEFVRVPASRNIEIRVYSALPPVQMYQTDDHVVVSFYPVDVTSWNAEQYHTSQSSQLGTFVSAKFDELWEAHSTRTLEQFMKVAVIVETGSEQKAYRLPFVTRGQTTYVNGREIIEHHAATGIGGLAARVVIGNAHGHREERGPYQLTQPNHAHDEVRKLFERKYGPDHHEMLLELVEVPARG